jgi:hypothetical protein
MWYKIARLSAWALLISLTATAATYLMWGALPANTAQPAPDRFHVPSDENWPAGRLPLYAVFVSAGALLVSGIGTASSIILGWRNERRQQRESQLRIEQLEAQLTQARRKEKKPNRT